MSVGMVMDRGTFSWSPDQDEQVCFPIPRVHQVSGVCSACVRKGVLGPLFLAGFIRRHQLLQLFHVDAGAVDAVARAKDGVDVWMRSARSLGNMMEFEHTLDEMLEGIASLHRLR